MATATGHFIRQGDKTTCGGVVIEADTRVMMFGVAHAREGDRVTCGKDGKVYVIAGGVSFIKSHGRSVAGTLDSLSSCPCRAQLIHSLQKGTYQKEISPASVVGKATVSTSMNSSAASPQARADAGALSYRDQGKAVPPLSGAEPIATSKPQEPGFYVVPRSTTREQLESMLFTSHNPAVLGKFRSLNSLLNEVKAGSMIVLSDPKNFQCTREDALLMETAAKINDALKPLSADEADFMVRHRDEIETFLAQGSTAIGIGEAMLAKNLEDVKAVLHDIETLHQRTLQKDGHLRSPEFFAERKRLLAQLNANLTAMTRKSIGFPDHPDLKSALGISTRSLVHSWTKAGAVEQIPGYATHIEGVARAAKVVKYGGWIGTAIGGIGSYMNVQDVCTAGNAEACKKVKFTETGSFAGGVAGGTVVGLALTAPTVGALCVGLGVPTGGIATLVCGVVVVGAASFAGGDLGGSFGEGAGEIIYERTR